MTRHCKVKSCHAFAFVGHLFQQVRRSPLIPFSSRPGFAGSPLSGGPANPPQPRNVCLSTLALFVSFPWPHHSCLLTTTHQSASPLPPSFFPSQAVPLLSLLPRQLFASRDIARGIRDEKSLFPCTKTENKSGSRSPLPPRVSVGSSEGFQWVCVPESPPSPAGSKVGGALGFSLWRRWLFSEIAENGRFGAVFLSGAHF